MTADPIPPQAPGRAKPGGEASRLRERLGADPLIWTDAMLAALESGVKGGRWFSLKDKIWRSQTLYRAWSIVLGRGGSCGADRVTLDMYAKQLDQRLASLQAKLMSGQYEPKPAKRVLIPKAGSKEKRPLGIPTVEDRVVQTALLLAIGPIFEIGFSPRSYGFRPGRGCKDALREVDGLLRQGHEWIVDADLKSYFDTISHGKLMELVRAKVADGLVLDLLEGYLKQGVIGELGQWEPTEAGTPQGAVISPLLANLYLDGLDHLLSQRGRKGRGRGLDHQRYPNSYFAEMGLFSLERACREACQSR